MANRKHDPGGRVRLKLPENVRGGAEFSHCDKYRHKLVRDWTEEGIPPRTVLYIGMNPSTADEDVSDPTCHREIAFARRDGYTRYLKGNMLDWRATSPKDLPRDAAYACSPRNLPGILEMADEAAPSFWPTGVCMPDIPTSSRRFSTRSRPPGSLFCASVIRPTAHRDIHYTWRRQRLFRNSHGTVVRTG